MTATTMRALTPSEHDPHTADTAVLAEIERRVLWLSTALIDHANRLRPNTSGIKVGGHQASSASMATIMTALWFHTLRAEDRVSVKPHASPALHAINYLLGELDESYLTTLRAYHGLQSYPSRQKDPDPVDYSTGSVGIGATAPIWGAIARRYVDSHFGANSDVPRGRQFALLGDAELDEGACWEAILDPMVADLGELTWIVDLNRQSLDRVIPNIAATRLQDMFAAAGWQVLTLKYGQQLESLYAESGGAQLRQRLDRMSNPEYQRLLRCSAAELRQRLPGPDPTSSSIGALLDRLDDSQLLSAIRNLGGHDLTAVTATLDAIDDSRPTIIFAYTIKGHGLPTAGHPQNHSALLSEAQMSELAERSGMDLAAPWRRFPAGSPEAVRCAAVADRLRRVPIVAQPVGEVPTDLGQVPTGRASTQQVLGRFLLDLRRKAPRVAGRIVTVSPDVASSTNLGGWLNKVQNWQAVERPNWFADDAETVLQWNQHPTGQHIELGIAEVNLVSLLGELGATWSRWGQPLLPIGTVYDPFVTRALEPWSFGIYAGGQSILVGTPSGVTLAPEGGAHQSIITPSIGIEQPGCVAYEPAFVLDFEWCLLAALAQLGRPDGRSAYFRASTRPIDQRLAAVPDDPAARERRRRHAIAGGYLLRAATEPAVTIVAMGAVVPEAVQAAERLAALGFGADVVCVTSADLLFRASRSCKGLDEAANWILEQILPAARARPMVTVLDGHPHTLAFLANQNQVPVTTLGVTEFGQCGDLDDMYAHHRIDTGTIVGAALDLIEP